MERQLEPGLRLAPDEVHAEGVNSDAAESVQKLPVGGPLVHLIAGEIAVFADNDLAAAGLAGTAACYSNKNQFALAAENYQAASAKAENKALKAQYLAHAGESYQQANELKKASDLFTKVIADYPGSTGAALSQRSLWQISGNL